MQPYPVAYVNTQCNWQSQTESKLLKTGEGAVITVLIPHKSLRIANQLKEFKSSHSGLMRKAKITEITFSENSSKESTPGEKQTKL